MRKIAEFSVYQFLIASLFASLSISPLATAQQFPLEGVAEKLDYLIGEEISWQGLTPAYSILVDQGGEVIYEKSVGLADIEQRVLATSDTVYQIGSISKSYTALAILQLVEKGKIKLNAKVKDYLSDYKGPGKNATVEQLLTHTSGIPNYTSLPEGRDMLMWIPTQREDIVALFEDLPLDFKASSNYSYSNSGYYLLGLIVEAASEQDFYAYLEENIYQPLGLNATFSGNYEEIVPNRARGYSVVENGFENAAPTPNLTPFAAGSIQASPRDVARYRRGVFKSGVFSEKLLNMLITTTSFPNGTENPYALGALSRGQLDEYTRWGHSGGISGFITHHAYYPQEDLTVVVMTNTGNPPVSPPELAGKVAAVVLGVSQETPTDYEKVTLPESTLARYAGEYVMSPFRITGDGKITLLHEEGQLLAKLGEDSPMPPAPLEAVGENLFSMGGLGGTIKVVEKNGKVTGLEITMGDNPWPAKRVK